MYDLYRHCTFNLNPRACSIDTPLHTFVPYTHVDHLHPNAVIAIAASVNQERLCREIYGDEVLYIPWQRPGFDIGLRIESLIRENPKAKGVLLGHHGMSSWSNDDKTCYETALEIVDAGHRLHRGARPGRAHLRGAEVRGPAGRGETERDRRHHPVAARTGLGRPALRGDGPGRSEDAALHRQRRRPPAREPGNVLPRPLPEDQDQAPLRRLEPGDAGRRGAEGRARGGPRRNTAATTRPTTSAASGPARLRCATRTRPSSSSRGWG